MNGVDDLKQELHTLRQEKKELEEENALLKKLVQASRIDIHTPLPFINSFL